MSSFVHSVSAPAPAPVTPVRQRTSTLDKLSPRTPSSTTSTPYTGSSGGLSSASSPLTTPSSAKFCPTSPRHTKSSKGIADLTHNWRVRAQLNGIKVSAGDENSKKAPFPLSSGYSHSLSPFPSPGSASHRSSSTLNTSPKVSKGKYTLGAFTAFRRSIVSDSPFSDIKEDDEICDSPQPTLPSLRALQDLSNSNSPLHSPQLQDARSSCSVCDKEPTASSRMIVLSPCSHVFCASCFTGTLNIVGEKNMSCMECHSPVDSFHFALGSLGNSLLGQPFEDCVPLPNTSKPASSLRNSRETMAVLRIDNVPWDVTPLTIKKFIKYPIIRAHVLLDVRGKTLSHAFVQLAVENARAALRSSQNAILGQGRRARAVTVTLSSQAELMAALYPQWRGSFDGCQPSLDGLDNEKVNEALQHGLISKAELDSLLNLITNPDSHFLKVPSLPFYSLISTLSTFPADVDSRIFWSGQLRDALFRMTLVALQNLALRKESEENLELWNELVAVSINCRAFTRSQVFKLQLAIHKTLVPDLTNPKDIPASMKLDILAEQFGLEPGVLAAIIQSFA